MTPTKPRSASDFLDDVLNIKGQKVSSAPSKRRRSVSEFFDSEVLPDLQAEDQESGQLGPDPLAVLHHPFGGERSTIPPAPKRPVPMPVVEPPPGPLTPPLESGTRTPFRLPQPPQPLAAPPPPPNPFQMSPRPAPRQPQSGPIGPLPPVEPLTAPPVPLDEQAARLKSTPMQVPMSQTPGLAPPPLGLPPGMLAPPPMPAAPVPAGLRGPAAPDDPRYRLGMNIVDFAGGVPGDAARAAAAIPQLLARIPGGLNDQLDVIAEPPPGRRPIIPDEDLPARLDAAIEENKKKRQAAALRQSLLDQALPRPTTTAGQIGGMFGSTVPFALGAAAGGPLAVAAMGSAMGAEEALERHEKSGVESTPKERAAVGLLGAAVGSLEAAPFERWARFGKRAAEVASKSDDMVEILRPTVKQYMKSAGIQGVEEAAQETASELGQNIIEAMYGGRKWSNVTENLPVSAAGGFTVGSVLDVLFKFAGSKYGRVQLRQAGIDPDSIVKGLETAKSAPPPAPPPAPPSAPPGVPSAPPPAPPSDLYGKAVEVSKNGPSFGMPTLVKKLGVEPKVAQEFLDRMESEGLIRKATNKKGKTVYHQTKKAALAAQVAPTPAAQEPEQESTPAVIPPSAGEAAAPPVEPPPAQAEGTVATPSPERKWQYSEDGKTVQVGQRTMSVRKDGNVTQIFEGDKKLYEAVRPATLEKWLDKQAQKEAEKPAATQPPPMVAEEPQPEAPAAVASPEEKPETPVSAELPTVPEPPAVIDAQVEQLKSGARRVVMIPEGTPEPTEARVPFADVLIPGAGRFIYDPKRITEGEIRAAASENRLPEILGAAEGGMGAPDKSAVQGEPVVVTARDEKGTPVQDTVTDQQNLPETVGQAEKLGDVEIRSPEDVLTERAAAPGETEQPSAVEKEKREFSSSQVEIEGPLRDRVLQEAANIPDSELAEDGREDKPHVTLKFGLHDDVPDGLRKALAGEGPIRATLGKVSIFENPGFDVVKVDVDSPDLHRLNKKVADSLPVTDTHPGYVPHVTLAYVKKGEGKKYAGRSLPGITGKEITFDSVTFSGKDRTKTPILLGKSTKRTGKRTEQESAKHVETKAEAPATSAETKPVSKVRPKSVLLNPRKPAKQDRPLGGERGFLSPDVFTPWRWKRTAPTLAPTPRASAGTRKKLRAKLRDADIPDATAAEISKALTGVEDISKLSQDQALKVIGELGRKIGQSGIYLHQPIGKGEADSLAASPSITLWASRSGKLIYDEARRRFFEQQTITTTFNRNADRILKKLSKEDRERIKVYRFVKQIIAADEGDTGRAEVLLRRMELDPAVVDEIENGTYLNDKQKVANDNLTKRVFHPIWLRAVKENLVDPERHIDDYLTFYREENTTYRGRDKKDAAALLAQELKIPLHIADQILENATTKKVTFGPLDLKRSPRSLPGSLPLEDILHIYIRGFARKSGVTKFLAVANKARKRIPDPELRAYARDYINQYAGRPMSSGIDNWLRKYAQTSKLGRLVVEKVFRQDPDQVSLEQLAIAATSLQYVTKIGSPFGGNPFSVMQNLFQILNSAAWTGLGRTLQGSARMALIQPAGWIYQKMGIPPRWHPLYRDIKLMRKAGITDSLVHTIDRPHAEGLAGKIMDFMTTFFRVSENFNRGTAFFAAYAQGKAKGMSEEAAIEYGRDAVQATQYFGGRLDSPLAARTPAGRVFYQFKTFSLKSMEMFFRRMNHVQRMKWIMGSLAIGGLTSLGIMTLLRTFFPNSRYTKMAEDWDQKFNLAAALNMRRFQKSVGIWQFPGSDQVLEVSKYGDKEEIARYIAGPMITAIVDTALAAINMAKPSRRKNAKQRAWDFATVVLRSWVPGGVTLNRAIRAMRQGQTPEDKIRIFLGIYDKNNKGKRIPGVSDFLDLLKTDRRPALAPAG